MLTLFESAQFCAYSPSIAQQPSTSLSLVCLAASGSQRFYYQPSERILQGQTYHSPGVLQSLNPLFATLADCLESHCLDYLQY